MSESVKNGRRGAQPGRRLATENEGKYGVLPFVATDEQRAQVLEFVAVGLAQAQIALLIKHPDGQHISVDTLQRHFREELDKGGLIAIANVGGAIYRGAVAGAANMARLYWNIHAHRFGLNGEKQRHEHTGPNGAPISMIDWSAATADMTPDQRTAMLPIIEKMIAAAAAESAGEEVAGGYENPDEDR